VHELALVAPPGWVFELVAPAFFHGDLRSLKADPALPDDGFTVRTTTSYLSRHIHLFFYGHELRQILHSRFDLVHAWEEPYILSGAQVAAWIPRSSALVFATFQNISKRYPIPFSWMEKRAVRRADGIVAWGSTVEESLAERPAYRGKLIRQIPVGVDLETFRPDPARRMATRRSLGWPDERTPVVGFLGRFVEEKGLRFLTGVLEQLTVPWRALFVGSGPLEHFLRSWSERFSEHSRVVTGVHHENVPAYLNAMDVLCAPSETKPTWREQFGRMIIEAFASGTAVISSDSGELPHTVGTAGLVLPELERGAWVSALERLLSESVERKQLAETGIEAAQSRFAWPLVARKHLDFFSEVIERRATAQ
jgi:glycosyltransferase involved in cell wall biosynthesis